MGGVVGEGGFGRCTPEAVQCDVSTGHVSSADTNAQPQPKHVKTKCGHSVKLSAYQDQQELYFDANHIMKHAASYKKLEQ